MDAAEATLSGKNTFWKVASLPSTAKELSSLISTDYHPFVVILSCVCRFVVKKIIIFILQFVLAAYTGMW